MLNTMMSSDEKAPVTQANETNYFSQESANLSVVPNFRVFSQQGYSASIVENPTHPLLVFGLVSFRNSIFQNPETVSQMIRDTDKEFEHLQRFTPTFYLYTEKLQSMTECLLPKDTTKLSIVTKKWSDAFKTTERQLQKERGKPTSLGERCILHDKKLENHPDFPTLKGFVEETLVKEEFSSRLSDAIDLYLANNLDKIKIAENTADDLSSEEKRDILRQYLVQEYTYFLLLGLLETYQRADEAFDQINITSVNIPVSITQSNPVQPIMLYPVSASCSNPTSSDGLAAVSLSLFLDIQKSYIEQCKTNEKLPCMTRGLLIVDIRVKHTKTPRQQKKEAKQTKQNISDTTLLIAATTKSVDIEVSTGRTDPSTSRRPSKTGSPKNEDNHSSPLVTCSVEMVVAKAILDALVRNKRSGNEAEFEMDDIDYSLKKQDKLEKEDENIDDSAERDEALATIADNVKNAQDLLRLAPEGRFKASLDYDGWCYLFTAKKKSDQSAERAPAVNRK